MTADRERPDPLPDSRRIPTTITGHGAARTVASATEPMRTWRSPVRP